MVERALAGPALQDSTRSCAKPAPFLDSVFLSKNEKFLDDASSSSYVPVVESWCGAAPD